MRTSIFRSALARLVRVSAQWDFFLNVPSSRGSYPLSPSSSSILNIARNNFPDLLRSVQIYRKLAIEIVISTPDVKALRK